jgi:hypothetical protein
MTQQHQQQAAEEARPMDVEPAHAMTREKHKQREHYERLLRELENEQRK